MTAVHGARPGRFLAAGNPLPRHPPASHFPRVGRVRQIQDHGDVAHVSFHDGREVGVPAVEGEAVDALSRGLEERHLAGVGRVRDVEDLEASLGVVIVLVALVVDDHNAVAHRGFVGVDPRRHIELSHELGILRIAHVDDGSSVRRVHVPHVGETLVHLDLAAAGQVHAGHLLDLAGRAESVACRHLDSPFALRSRVSAQGPTCPIRGKMATTRPIVREWLVWCLTNTLMNLRGHFGCRQGVLRLRCATLRTSSGVHHARKSNAADGQKDPQIRKRICETPH